MKKWREGPGGWCHVDDVHFYLGMHFAHAFLVATKSTYSASQMLRTPALGQTFQEKASRSFEPFLLGYMHLIIH